MPKGGACKQNEQQPGQSRKISKSSNNRFWRISDKTIKINYPNTMHIIQQSDYGLPTFLQNISRTFGAKFVRLVDVSEF